jgi:hypothetical protein
VKPGAILALRLVLALSGIAAFVIACLAWTGDLP